MTRVLFVSAHADDAMLGAGGVMKYYIDQGCSVHYLAFSIAEESVPEGFARDVVRGECEEAACYLGLPPENVLILGFKVRKFPDFRQDILDILIEQKKRINPDVVFTPSSQDMHQDHKVVYEETIRAFMKSCSIYGYDFPWNVLFEGKLNLFFEITDSNLRDKISACQRFKSQLAKMNNCLSPEYLRSLAIERGNRINRPYAESFEVIREVRRADA